MRPDSLQSFSPVSLRNNCRFQPIETYNIGRSLLATTNSCSTLNPETRVEAIADLTALIIATCALRAVAAPASRRSPLAVSTYSCSASRHMASLRSNSGSMRGSTGQ